MEYATEIMVDDLVFPECPRWHEGALWFADVHAHRVMRVGADRAPETMVEHRQPAGLGWTPDGALLFVAMVDRALMRADEGGVRQVADLSSLEPCQLNDMVVDAHGNAYIGGFGFDINRGEAVRASSVYFVRASGEARVAADEMMFPNGLVITADGRTLIVAETVARRLTAFDIAADGALSGRRVWASLDVFPDGICLDTDGAIWVASPVTGECVLVREGGDVGRRIKARANGVYACALGGDDGRTLYLCTANTTGPELAEGRSVGWIERVRV
jgi:sugar lactone lactonase YvrE